MSNPCALLTGASGGIGAAIANELFDLGYEVYGIGRNFEKMDSPSHPQFHPIELELTDIPNVISTVEKLRREHSFSLLINNAGCAYYGLHEEIPCSAIHEMVTVNLEVPILLTRLLLRDLKAVQGQIIQISSVTAKHSSPHACAYGATKAGLSAFSSSLFDEARKYGVKVTTVHPDLTCSDFYRNADFEPADEFEYSLAPQDVANCVRSILFSRDGMVVTDLTVRPQKNRIVKRQNRKD